MQEVAKSACWKSEHLRADGRKLWIYRHDAEVQLQPGHLPELSKVSVASHMRWHPLLGEWVIYASHRQDRTHLPTEDPLSPTIDPAHPTELPAGAYDVAIFENRFPTLAANPGPPPQIPAAKTAPAIGRCEVVVFSQSAKAGWADLSSVHAALVLEAMADRTQALQRDGLKYVLPFENRGVEMGVTLHHPHGQIYAYDIMPAQQARAWETQQLYYNEHGRTFMADLIAREQSASIRIINESDQAISFTPPFARFPFETWIAPKQNESTLADLTPSARLSLAQAIQNTVRRLDALFNAPMPYLMTFNQAPLGFAASAWGLRIEIWPIRRAQNKLKYLAGTELGAGVFASDILPEYAANALRETLP